jgi:predicted transcriptional regulator
MSHIRSNARRIKELRVLKLHDKGYSSRQIAKEAHVSLREVTKYIKTISKKRKSPSKTSIHDEIVLEYTVNLLRSEVRDLRIERDNLKNEVNDSHAQKYNVLNQLRVRQSKLDAMKRDLEYERYAKEVLKDILI